jgi:hypothetical protein
MELYLYHLFRHQAADNILYFKELAAACCHLFLKEEKEFTSRLMCYKFHIVHCKTR